MSTGIYRICIVKIGLGHDMFGLFQKRGDAREGWVGAELASAQGAREVTPLPVEDKAQRALQSSNIASDSVTLPASVPVKPAAIDVHDLKKSYALKPILRHVDFSLAQGQRMALLGANGAGKTTLLRILVGLTRPSAGSVSIMGLDSVRDAQQVRHLVGFVAHQPYLYEELTALENLLFFARMYAVEHAVERAQALLQCVGMEKRMRERVSALSRGQVQRVSWARALLHAPRLLLLDEPETGLDQQGNELVNALLAEHIAHGGSLLFTTHQLERAQSLSDSIVILGRGRVAYQQRTDKLEPGELRRRYQEVTR